jgi:hypothetical protein
MHKKITGKGLGFRRDMLDDLDSLTASDIDFIEVAPENWIKLGPDYLNILKSVVASKPLVTHGLSLSIGSPDALDIDFVESVGVFLDDFNVLGYSEHLSYCSANGHLYDLLPIPFTKDAATYVAKRIKEVQNILQRQIAMENVSYYLEHGSEMTELEFLLRVLEQSDCQLLLDVNNVYVNSINHKYDAKQFIDSLPSERIMYGHIAGHYDEADDLKIDTHGADVKKQVWNLLRYSYEKHGVFGTLLERDFNLPPMNELLTECDNISKIQSHVLEKSVA